MNILTAKCASEYGVSEESFSIGSGLGAMVMKAVSSKYGLDNFRSIDGNLDSDKVENLASAVCDTVLQHFPTLQNPKWSLFSSSTKDMPDIKTDTLVGCKKFIEDLHDTVRATYHKDCGMGGGIVQDLRSR